MPPHPGIPATDIYEGETPQPVNGSGGKKTNMTYEGQESDAVEMHGQSIVNYSIRIAESHPDRTAYRDGQYGLLSV